MRPTLTHLALHVRDLAACIEFYRRYCGLEIVRERDREAGGGGVVWLRAPKLGFEQLCRGLRADLSVDGLVVLVATKPPTSLTAADKIVPFELDLDREGRIGLSRALDLILTGRPLDADEAFAFGLANRVVPVGDARIEAERLAAQLAAFPQAADWSGGRLHARPLHPGQRLPPVTGSPGTAGPRDA